VLTLDLSDGDGEPVENAHEWLLMLLLLGLCSSSGMAGNMFVYDNTEPTRQILAEEAEPAHSCRAFRGLDLFVVLYVVGVIPVTHPSFRAGISTLTTGIIPKTSTHNNRYASYLFTLP